MGRKLLRLAALWVIFISLLTQTQAATLDELFQHLKAAPNEAEAQRLEDEIWEKWTRPADPVLAKTMADVLLARRYANFDKALKLLDSVIRKHPDYSEAYNQRATIRFLQGKDELSLTDIVETLKREPRHFGALAGRALIHLRNGKSALAFQSVKAAMEFHPYLRERHLFPELMKRYPRNQ